jgi:hypothetical protein
LETAERPKSYTEAVSLIIELAPTLGTDQFRILMEIARRQFGPGDDPEIDLAGLAVATRLTENQAEAAVQSLKAMGLIRPKSNSCAEGLS